MRIIAGERRGHKIESPSKKGTRPTSDMVRESIFNILGSLVDGRTVYDLFAGSGALGLEALSRGASRAVFVERDRANVALITRNAGHLRYEGRVYVVTGDAYRWMSTFDPSQGGPPLIFLDAPYRDYEDKSRRAVDAIAGLAGRLPNGAVMVVEAPERLDPSVLPEAAGWDVRRYGGTRVGFLVVEREADANGEPAMVDQAL